MVRLREWDLVCFSLLLLLLPSIFLQFCLAMLWEKLEMVEVTDQVAVMWLGLLKLSKVNVNESYLIQLST